MLRRNVIVACALCLLITGCKEALFTQLAEREANEMLDALYAARITALKTTADGKTWSVQVERENLPLAIRVLKDRGLPRQSFTSTGDLFKKQGFVSSPTEERVRYLYSVSQELERTLTQIDGVIVARVHPVIPANDPLTGKIKPASASVFIKTRQNAEIEMMTPAIRNLVTRSVEGVSPDNISITFTTSEAPVGSDSVTPLPPQFRLDQPTVMAAIVGALMMLVTCAIAHLIWRRRQMLLREREAVNQVPNRSQLFGIREVIEFPPRRAPRRATDSVDDVRVTSLDSARQREGQIEIDNAKPVIDPQPA